jgi:hypothetical protein
MTSTAEHTAIEAAYLHLASFRQGEWVTINAPALGGGDIPGIVKQPLRCSGPDIEHAVLVVNLAPRGTATAVTAQTLLGGFRIEHSTEAA